MNTKNLKKKKNHFKIQVLNLSCFFFFCHKIKRLTFQVDNEAFENCYNPNADIGQTYDSCVPRECLDDMPIFLVPDDNNPLSSIGFYQTHGAACVGIV